MMSSGGTIQQTKEKTGVSHEEAASDECDGDKRACHGCFEMVTRASLSRISSAL